MGAGLGGLPALIARADANAAALDAWVQRTPWIEHLAADPATRSNTSVCLKFADAAVPGSTPTAQMALVKKMAAARSGRRRLRHRQLPRRAAGPAHLVRRHGRDRRHRSARPLARLGLPHEGAGA
jgi:hypothetical protein